NWYMTFIPGGKDGKNEQTAKSIAEHLHIECSQYVCPNNGGSMTSSNNEAIRKKVLDKKFPSEAFHNDEIRRISKFGRNICIYDDAIKSGGTMVRVLEPLLKELSPTSNVVAVVDVLWGTWQYEMIRID